MPDLTDDSSFATADEETEAGRFRLRIVDGDFNISPVDEKKKVPHQQYLMSQELYAIWNVLKLLKERGFVSHTPRKDGLRKDNWDALNKSTFELGKWEPKIDSSKGKPGYESDFSEFRRRLREATEVGLCAEHALPITGRAALLQIREDIATRIGSKLKWVYLMKLAFAGIFVSIFGIFLVIASIKHCEIQGYGWAILASAFGCLLTVAAKRERVKFENLVEYTDFNHEPKFRMIFVSAFSVAILLLIDAGVLEVTVNDFDFSDFDEEWKVAAMIGLAAGIAERSVSLTVIETAGSILGRRSADTG